MVFGTVHNCRLMVLNIRQIFEIKFRRIFGSYEDTNYTKVWLDAQLRVIAIFKVDLKHVRQRLKATPVVMVKLCQAIRLRMFNSYIVAFIIVIM